MILDHLGEELDVLTHRLSSLDDDVISLNQRLQKGAGSAALIGYVPLPHAHSKLHSNSVVITVVVSNSSEIAAGYPSI